MICAYAIAKNEEKNVYQFIHQTRVFDEVCVLDTGSNDNTVEILRDNKINVSQKIYQDFDFSMARNTALSLASTKCKWFFSLDFNESLKITDEQISTIIKSDSDGFQVECGDFYDKNYQEYKLKIHQRDSFIWKYAVHEYLEGCKNQVTTEKIGVKITKRTFNSPQKSKFYADICEREHKKTPNDPHYSWWILSYYSEIKDYEKLLYHSLNYLKYTPPYCNEFRIYAFIYASKCMAYYGNLNKSIDYAIHALSEAIVFREVIPGCFMRAQQQLKSLNVNITLQN